MRIKSILLLSLLLIAGLASAGLAQSPKNSIVTGDVASIDAAKIVLKTKDGEVSVTLTDKTEYKRVPADNPSMKAAVASELGEIAAGDKLTVVGIVSEDKKSVPAKTVYLMSKDDLAMRQKKDNERWATRGISGRIKSVNPDTNQITIEVSSVGGTTPVVLTPKADAKYKRYAPNSIKYSEAQASTFADMKPGDVMRAVGDKSADGASFAAEEILAGSFQTVAGTVKAVDTAKNEVVITDLQTKKDITVDLSLASVLKKFPEQMAQMMAMRQAGGAGGRGQGTPPAGGQGQPRPDGAAAGQPGGARPGGQRAGGIDEMLERFPTISAADLKVGDIIAVSATKGTNLERITAIKLLAGVEPFIRAAQATTGGQRGQGSQSLNIPGLEGMDIP
jgi:ribosomal protein L24